MEQTYTGGTADEKIKTHFARIIVTGKTDKPYYEIMYYDPKDKMFYIGYSSYDLGIVKGFLKRYFEVEGINDPLFFAAGMTFGDAIQAAKMGKRIARRGWNGKGQYVELGRNFAYTTPDCKNPACFHEDIGSAALVFVGTRGRQVGWLASQADMLADDWMLLPDCGMMSWPQAEEAIKEGKAVCRTADGWEGVHFVGLIEEPEELAGKVCMVTRDGTIHPDWQPSPDDLTGSDWFEVYLPGKEN